MNYYHRELYPKYMVKMQDNFKEHQVIKTVTIKEFFNVNMYVCVLTCIYLLFFFFFFVYRIYIK